ncbi:MAG: hypothetical protein ACLTSL_01675 [Odoribacter splanchnicus]
MNYDKGTDFLWSNQKIVFKKYFPGFGKINKTEFPVTLIFRGETAGGLQLNRRQANGQEKSSRTGKGNQGSLANV